MRILVCIKQVADSESRPVINGDASWAVYDEKTAYKINLFDEHAIEEALRIRDTLPGTTVDILSIGPERVRQAIRRGIEMGADNGIHIRVDNTGYLSPSVKARLISGLCTSMRYDLIITGVMSEDMMSGQTGPMLAALLGCPSASGIMKLGLDAGEMEIHVERELDGGAACSMKICLPALVTVQSGINRPRYPSLSNVLRAKGVTLTEVVPHIQNAPGKHESVSGVVDARPQRAGRVLHGTTAEKAEELWQILHKKSLI